MTADRLLIQHKLEGMAKRLKQLHHSCDDMVQHVTLMDHWCAEVLTLEQGDTVREAIDKTRAALVAVQIDLDSTAYTLYTAQIRAKTVARLVSNSITLRGTDDEKQ